MANWDLVSPYTAEDAAWLRNLGLPHPAVRPGNQMPTTADMKWALEADDRLVFEYPREDEELYAWVEGTQPRDGLVAHGFDWDADHSIPGDHFFIRGSEVVLSVLVRLCGRCGQLFCVPDSGAPAVVLDATLDTAAVRELYDEACARVDSWEFFFKQMYGSDGLTGRKAAKPGIAPESPVS